MNNTGMLVGQRITSPDGPGEVLEIIGDKVIVKLDDGGTETFSEDDLSDDSNAG